MPKQLPADLTKKIETEIVRHLEGVGIDDLHAALAEIISRRTLQRRLGELADQKKIVTIGKGRSLRYRQPGVIEVQLHTQAGTTGKMRTEFYVPISPASQEVLDYVRQPIQGRKPVGYDRKLLETYRPNETHYLAQDIRDHLHNIGRPPMANAMHAIF